MNKSYYGNYLGMVVQNDDPEHRGRVKIWVPHISAVIYDKWNNSIKDKNVAFLGTDNPDLAEILPTLKAVLPWAECAAPLFGGNSSGRYNAQTDKGTTSDSNYWEGDKLVDGNRPLQNYIGPNVYPDPFTKTGENYNHFINPYAYQYTPSNYSNMARGLFTIPNVGAHVWVFFMGGEPNAPVYFAVSYGKEDWQKIYSMSQSTEEKDEDFKSVDYPQSYENVGPKEGGELNADSKTFRNKTVLNSNKHSIELVDTDHREILKLTHYTGSFKEFSNYANIELATNNDQKMVIGDQFYTVQKNQSIYIGNTQDVIVAGDQYLHVGKAKVSDVQDVVTILKEIHEYKKLFDVQRAQYGEAPNDVSIYQKRVGNPAVCPVCKGTKYSMDFGVVLGELVPTNPLLFTKYNSFITSLVCTVRSVSNGIVVPDPSLYEPVSSLIGGSGIWKGCVCNVCRGTTKSPSTQDGEWEIDSQKTDKLNSIITNNVIKLAEIERKLGEGDQIITITKNKVENIGLLMNDMKSFRVDPIGKLRINSVYVAVEDTYPSYKPSPHVEYVDVDDIPGGDYNLTIGNKYKLLVGAKGISMKTFGPIDVYGTIINIAGEQVNISSANEVLIDGGERLTIRARSVSLIPFEHNPVVVEGQLHVTRNMVIGGGTLIEGETALTHVTAPFEYAETEDGPIMTKDGKPIPGTGNIVLETGVGGSMGQLHTHIIPLHRHYYKRIASTLLPSQEAVREYMRAGGPSTTGDSNERSINLNNIINADQVSSSPFEDLSIPDVVYAASNELAYSLYGERANKQPSVTKNMEGTITYVMYFNLYVNSEGKPVPESTDAKFNQGGLEITCIYNPDKDKVISTSHKIIPKG